ncbi:MAG TPA: energy-coupling factor transporter transmembrane protein EcfT [archaeon]|nr:energy-coupling factor transporter transmembrane protein EcfT [archaeon]
MSNFINLYPAQYRPGTSRAHFLDARFKVLLAGLLSVAVWSVDSFAGLGIIFSLVGAWVFLLKEQARSIAANLGSLVYIFFLVLLYYGWSEFSGSNGSLGETAQVVLLKSILLTGKLGVVFISAFWLYFSTAPIKVVDALGILLKPLEKIRIPVREFAFIVGLIIRFFPASVARIGDLYRNLRLRETLAGGKNSSFKKYRRAVGRIIDTMVLYMHYSLYEAELLSLSLMARGYNPFRPVRLTDDKTPEVWEVLFTALSAAVIILAACWF